MHEVLLIVGVAIAAFVSTNLDNLFLLVGVMRSSRFTTRDVAIPYACVMGLVLLIGLAGSYAADVGAQSWLRYLGLVPLVMGLWRMRAMIRPAAAVDGSVSALSGRASVFGITLANSGDSLGVFAPLMGETSELLVVVIFATALAMAVAWASVARWVAEHPALAPRLHAVDRYGVPLVLIAIGVYILSDTSTDTV